MRLETQAGPANETVETAIGEQNAALSGQLGPALAASLPADPPDLENIGKIAGKGERQRDVDVVGAVIGKAHPLPQRTPVKIDRPGDVDGILGEPQLPLPIDVGIGEIDGKTEIVGFDFGMQQERLGAFDQELEVRKIACVAVK